MPRGGFRPNSGRKPKSLTDTPASTPKNDFKFDVIKEQIDLYKKLKKSSDPKALALMASLLKDIAPYLEKKQPTAPVQTEDNTPTVIEIVDVDGDGGDIV